MHLSLIDWIIIALFLLVSLFIGLWYKDRANKSLSDFFLSGRNLPWYIAGTSMVATTFAADTPLAVTELVAKNGISGNWLWWNMLIGGMLTTFFFARLWRKANILTELELIELRYTGKAAAFLRGFKAIYLGIFMNTIIIGWVNVALMTIIKVFFNVPDEYLIWIVAAAMLITMIYSAISGLWGVAITDLVQFVIAMTGCIILAIIVINSEKIGGITGLKEKLPAWSLDFFPVISAKSATGMGSALSISIGAFLAYTTIQWWASWYPGAEPGGGGYVAQRMMSCKNEKHAVFSTLFFQIAHYCLRPWPWILVGLASIVLYPELGADEKKFGYVLAMKEFLPIGLKGLLLVAFLAAYMSTIATQLNWGASYLINDFFKRFIKKENAFASPAKAQKFYVTSGKLATIFTMLIALFVTTQIKTISGVWQFIIECGAGLGLVLILRWYWWRINAWSEIAATISPFIFYSISHFILNWEYPNSFFFTTGLTTLTWLMITFFTKPVEKNHLQNFYNRIKPDGLWKKFKTNDVATKKPNAVIFLFLCWISSIVMTYALLFFMGKIIFLEWSAVFIWGATALVAFLILIFSINRTNVLE